MEPTRTGKESKYGGGGILVPYCWWFMLTVLKQNSYPVYFTRGLGDRLSQLEHLLIDAKKKVAEQQDLAAAFLQNQASVWFSSQCYYFFLVSCVGDPGCLSRISDSDFYPS